MRRQHLGLAGALLALASGQLTGCGDSSTASGGYYGPLAGSGGGSGKAGAGGKAGSSAHGGSNAGGEAGQGSAGEGPGGSSGQGQGGSAGQGPGGSAGAGLGGSSGQGPGGTSSGGSAGAGPGGSGGGPPACSAGTIECDGNTKKVCDGKGGYSETTVCPKACLAGTGCVECSPGTGTCSGATAMSCKSDGSGYVTTTCDPDLGLSCLEGKGVCQGACSPDSLQRSYIGCEYFPTVTSNSELFNGFHFAAVVTNTTTQPAQVKVMQGDTMVASATVAPGALQTIQLPWVDALKSSSAQTDSGLPSSLVPKGAYHLKSTQPVTVYQFNPLEFELSPPPSGCPDQTGTGSCNSFTNDASLLLPVNSQGTEYVVASAAALSIGQSDIFSTTFISLPGLVAITGLADGTTVTLASTAYVAGGSGVNPMNPGDTQTFMLNKGDVVQVMTAPVPQSALTGCVTADNGNKLCAVPKAYDLTGSIVKSDKPVQVIGGHNCDFMPYSNYACDHLEESIFPVNTLGSEIIVTAPQSIAGASSGNGGPDKHIIRVISAADGNQISLDPPLFPGGTLNKGQYADIPATDKDLVVKGSGPLVVAQFMLSAEAITPGSTGSGIGDPSLSLAVPSSQYRKSYSFLAPESYTYNFVNVIAPTGATVKLDGQPVSGFSQVGSSAYGVKRVKVSGGAHNIEGDVPFGIVVHGYGLYTSYMYPGGLDLKAKE